MNGRSKSKAELMEERAVLQKQLEAFHKGAEHVLSSGDFQTIARSIFDLAREMTGAQSGYVALLNDNGDENELLFLEAGELACDVDPDLPMPIRGLRAEAYRSGQTVFDNDFMNSRWMEFMPAGHVMLKNVLFAPLNINGKTLGIMGLANKPTDFSDEDCKISESLGKLAAIALRNSRNLDAFKRSEAHHRTLVNTIPDLIWLKDPEGVYISCNKTFESFFGAEEADIIGKTDYDFVDRDLADFFRDHDRKAMKANAPSTNEEWLIFAETGYHGLFETIKTPMRDADGKLIGILGIARNITEREVAEQRIKKEKDRAQQYLNVAGTMFLVLDTNQQVTLINPAGCRILGYEEKEILGRNWFDNFVPEEDAGTAKTAFSQIVSVHNNLFEYYENNIVRKDGQKRLIAWHNSILREEDRIAGTLSSGEDITERREMEEELKRTAALLQAAMDCSPAGIAIGDASTEQLMYVNGAALEIWEITKKEVADGIGIDECGQNGKTLHLDGTPYKDDEIPLIRAIRYGETCNRECIIRKSENEDRIVWSHAAPVRNEAGEIIAGIVVFPDITELKKVEGQLRQSQKMESIGRLAGGIAHDFNNLLTAIRGFSDIIQESLKPDDPIKKDVTEIQKAAKFASSLTSQLLAFSRKQLISPKVLDLNSVVGFSEKILRRIMGEDIDLIFNPTDGLKKILMDPNQIDQILINLCVNSRDAMPDGGKVIIKTMNVSLDKDKCDTSGKPVTGEFVMLAFSDNGAGMSKKTRENIFEPFFTTKEKGKSTGLGLSTIHGIIQQNNGHISVFSVPGKGTTFKIYFPVTQEEKEPGKTTEKVTDSTGNETILLVEDMELVRKLTVRILKQQGYHILEASSGTSAVEIYKEHGSGIDLLVTDVVMPEMSGKRLFETLAEIKPNLKVLFMSGFAENAISHHGIIDEDTNFIQKPFRPQDLAEKVRQVLDN